MGSYWSDMSKGKVVVVIGGGFFGISTANRLAKSNIKVILITVSKNAYFLVSSIRVPVQNKTEGTFIANKEIVDSRVEIIQDYVESFTEDEVFLKDHGKLTFDALVIATGAKWPDPIGSNILFEDNYKEYFERRYHELKNAKHIVLVGGGYNNLELTGELIHQYEQELKSGEKKITMLHSKDLLLPDDPFYSLPLRKKVTKFISDSNVDLRLKSRGKPLDSNPNSLVINGDPDDVVEGDYIIYGTGAVPSVPPNEIKTLCDPQGFIRVEDTFRVKAIPKGKIFAIGDVTDFEYRGLVLRRPWLSTVVNNVKLVLRDQDVPDNRLAKVVRPTGHVTTAVSLGPHHGYGQITLPLFGTVPMPQWFVLWSKSNDLCMKYAKVIFNS